MTRMKRRKLGLGALIVLPGFTVLEATRANGWDFPAQGTWADCNIVTSIRQTGPFLRVVVDISQTFTGTLDGGYVGTEDTSAPSALSDRFQMRPVSPFATCRSIRISHRTTWWIRPTDTIR